ncbi:MAG: hypothetical protein ACOX5T_08740 [Candidatus Cryptobacteroides sp.]
MVIFFEYYRMSFRLGDTFLPARGHVPPGSGYVPLSGSGARSSRLGGTFLPARGTFLFPARGHVPLGSGARSSSRRLKPRPENAGKCTHIHGFLKILAKGNPKPRSAAAREGIPGRETRGSGLGRGPRRHARTKKPGIWAWQRAGKAPQDRKAGNPGLAGGWKGAPGAKSRESGLGRGLEGHPRTGNAGIRAWQGAGTAPQDRKVGNTGLAGGWKGVPGRE